MTEGATAMTDQDNLRDRIESIIEDKTYATAPDGYIAGTEEAAQAIIDELGLTVETRLVHKKTLDRDVLERLRRVIGDWREESEWSNPTRNAGNAGTWTPGTSEENANDPTDAEDHATSSTP